MGKAVCSGAGGAARARRRARATIEALTEKLLRRSVYGEAPVERLLWRGSCGEVRTGKF
jgi:hypothetical protein